jgi:hypothetical protein
MSTRIEGSTPHSVSIDMLTSADRDVSVSTIDGAVGDPITAVAVLLAQSFREERKQALDASDAAEAARVREVEQQVQKMRDKADALRAEGWIRGTTMVLSGGFSALGALQSIRKSDADATNTMTRHSACGKGVEGIGTGLGGSYDATAQEHQGDADLHEARAGVHKVTSEKYRDDADEAQRMVRKVMDFLEQAKASHDATAGAAAAIRG